MSENSPPDDKPLFEQHPDVRGLQGVDSTSATGAYLNPKDVAAGELIDASPELVHMDAVVPGAQVWVSSINSDGQTEETVFVRTGTAPHYLHWAVRTVMPNGDALDEKALPQGAKLPNHPTLYLGGPRRGAQFVYDVMPTLTGKSGADFPADMETQGIFDFSAMPHVDQVPPEHVEANIKIGIMRRLADGSLEWAMPVSRIRRTTALVSDAVVVPPEDQQTDGIEK